MICENCLEKEGVKYSKYSTGRFCSSKCAKAFSTKNNRAETNAKVSLALKGRPSPLKGKKSPLKGRTSPLKGLSLSDKDNDNLFSKNTHKYNKLINDPIFVEKLLTVVKEEISMSACARVLNIEFKMFKKLALKLDVFTPNQAGVGILKSKLQLDDITSGKVKVRTQYLKKRLINLGVIEDKCSVCGIIEWMGKPITLELDHIDGEKYNNMLNNLRVICPNCHSQTDTYKGKNIKKDKHKHITDDFILEEFKKGLSIYEVMTNCHMAAAGNYKRFKKLYDIFFVDTVVNA